MNAVPTLVLAEAQPEPAPNDSEASRHAELRDRVMSIHPQPPEAWTVASELLVAYGHGPRVEGVRAEKG